MQFDVRITVDGATDLVDTSRIATELETAIAGSSFQAPSRYTGNRVDLVADEAVVIAHGDDLDGSDLAAAGALDLPDAPPTTKRSRPR